LPTPVSALIHAATMVKFCYKLIILNLLYHYMLEKPYIKFIRILINLNKTYKKILCPLNKLSGRVNQQGIISFISITNVKKNTSETISDITYNLNNYLNLKPEHKSKDNTKFLEWFIGFV